MKTGHATSAAVAFLLAIAGCGGGEPGIQLQPQSARSDEALAQQQDEYTGNIYPFFEEYCFSCHGIRKNEAGIDLRAATSVLEIGQKEDTWRRVLTMIETGQMPPADERQPTQFDRDDIAGFIEAELDASIRAMQPDPGRVTARRLNRQEYEYTILDLLGVETRVARSFPVDDSGYGFDNIGDVLSISPLLMEKYMTAAEEVASAAMERDRAPPADGVEAAPKILVCGHAPGMHRTGCAKTIIRDFAARAYRRPVTGAEVRKLTELVRLVEREGGSVEEGIQLAIETVLLSPKFLFRIEHDQRPHDPDYLRYVNDYELASRLSYFLWSSMPDEELFRLASEGALRDPKVLSAQVTRMIGDEKAWRFVENFAGQWLQLRNLDLVKPDRDLFPKFSRDLRNAMRKESEMFFDAMLREDRNLLEFLSADFTFVNEPLATHYGIEGIEGKDHKRIAVDGVQRGGVLTQASVLTLTSYPTRTSPVIRGAWVLENILGTAPPPPPPDVPTLQDNPEKLTGTLREQLEAHRQNATCASCHSRIDPLGFGLENYDAIGAWRTLEREFPVDSSGTLPSGHSFEGSADLRAILKGEPGDFVRCFTEKVLTYALGRGVEPFDRPVVAGIVDRVENDEYRFHTLIREVVASVPFQMRRGEGGGEFELSQR